MPTYSYRCTECGTAFDIQQSFTDDALTICPNCSGRLRKLFHNVGVTFNGTGFYRNDSRPTPKEGGSDSASPTPTPDTKAAPTVEKKSAAPEKKSATPTAAN